MATPLAKEAIRTKINNFIKTNGNEEITASQVNEIYQDILDSYPNKITDAILLGLNTFSSDRAYRAGEGCFHDGRLLQAKMDIPAGGFDSSQWDDVLGLSEAETTINFTGAWSSTMQLPSARKVNVYVNASNSTLKTIQLNNDPMLDDVVMVKDVKGDAGSYEISISSPNGNMIEGETDVFINKNHMAYTLKFDGEGWNII